MPRKPDRPQKARHILIFDDDWDFLLKHYGPASATRFGVSPAIRQIVHHAVVGLRAKIEAMADDRDTPGHRPADAVVEVLQNV